MSEQAPDLLKLLVNALHDITPGILRDFDELRYLQSSVKLPFNFAESSREKVKVNLIEKIKKIKVGASLYLDSGEEIYKFPKEKFKIIINLMDGFLNFTRNLNNFTIDIILKKVTGDGEEITLAGLIYAPSLGELYSALKGAGVWMKIKEDFYSKSQRLRVSTITSDILILLDNIHSVPQEISKNQYAITNCPSLNIAYVSAAKAERAILNNSSFLLELANLFIKEAGGSLKEENNLLIISNEKP